ADAQYDLARLYLKTPDASRDDFRYGARWLGLAAQKGQHQAQAMLGQMLFAGDRLPRQAARGLMWLTLARDNAAPDESWIRESYNRAFTKASDEDRAMALQMLEHWVQGKKGGHVSLCPSCRLPRRDHLLRHRITRARAELAFRHSVVDITSRLIEAMRRLGADQRATRVASLRRSAFERAEQGTADAAKSCIGRHIIQRDLACV